MIVAGIYKITSPSGRVYIGQSWDIYTRWRSHKNEKRFKGALQFSFIKHGYLNHTFEIIHELPLDVSMGIMDEYEILYINQYRNTGHTMLNMAPGGAGGKGYKHTEEAKKKMSEFAKKRGVSAEKIALMHKANTGKKLKPETKEKIRQSLLGIKHTQERIDNIKANRRVTEETKRKISASLTGRHYTSGKFIRGINHLSAKLDPDKVREIRSRYIPVKVSIRMLAKEYGVDSRTIGSIIRREIWKHVE